MARNGHGRFGRRCPLLRDERKSLSSAARSAFDPERTITWPLPERLQVISQSSDFENKLRRHDAGD
jgi:hypothetical protein